MCSVLQLLFDLLSVPRGSGASKNANFILKFLVPKYGNLISLGIWGNCTQAAKRLSEGTVHITHDMASILKTNSKLQKAYVARKMAQIYCHTT
jgi:hypothetical protein